MYPPNSEHSMLLLQTGCRWRYIAFEHGRFCGIKLLLRAIWYLTTTSIKRNDLILQKDEKRQTTTNMLRKNRKGEQEAEQPYSMRIAGPSSFNSANDVFLKCALTSSDSIPTSFVQIHVEAYILTLHPTLANKEHHHKGQGTEGERVVPTYRSMQLPGTLTATLLTLNPHSPNTRIYHGSSPALLSITLPFTLSARFNARICLSACVPVGGNQSIESMTTTIVRVPGRILAITSEISSVWMRSPLKAFGLESLTCDFGERYVGCEVGV